MKKEDFKSKITMAILDHLINSADDDELKDALKDEDCEEDQEEDDGDHEYR